MTGGWRISSFYVPRGVDPSQDVKVWRGQDVIVETWSGLDFISPKGVSWCVEVDRRGKEP